MLETLTFCCDRALAGHGVKELFFHDFAIFYGVQGGLLNSNAFPRHWAIFWRVVQCEADDKAIPCGHGPVTAQE